MRPALSSIESLLWPLRLDSPQRRPQGLRSLTYGIPTAATADPSCSSLGPPQPPTSTPRHTTNPPVACLGRPFLIENVSKGRRRVGEPLTTAPPGGRFWHGFAVRRPQVGGGGWGLTFVRFGGSFAIHPMQRGAKTYSEGMARKSTAPSFFTERSLAAYLAVSDRTIRNWIRRGELPSYKLGASRRIDPADVEDFLARHRDAA